MPLKAKYLRKIRQCLEYIIRSVFFILLSKLFNTSRYVSGNIIFF